MDSISKFGCKVKAEVELLVSRCCDDSSSNGSPTYWLGVGALPIRVRAILGRLGIGALPVADLKSHHATPIYEARSHLY